MGNVFQGSIKKKYRSSVKAKFHHTKTVFVPGRFHSFTVVAAGGGGGNALRGKKLCCPEIFVFRARSYTYVSHISVAAGINTRYLQNCNHAFGYSKLLGLSVGFILRGEKGVNCLY